MRKSLLPVIVFAILTGAVLVVVATRQDESTSPTSSEAALAEDRSPTLPTLLKNNKKEREVLNREIFLSDESLQRRLMLLENSDLTEKESRDFAPKVVMDWFESVDDPVEIGNWLMERQSRPGIRELFKALVYKWAEFDIDSTVRWIESLEPSPTRDFLIVRTLFSTRRYGSLETIQCLDQLEFIDSTLKPPMKLFRRK